jgi:chitodextrinase
MSDQVCCSTSLIRFPLPTPTGLAAVPTDTELALTWGAVTGAISYTVTWSGGGESGSATTTTPSYTITGLTAGTAYTVSVVAVPDPTSNDDPSRPAVLVTGTTGGAVLPTPANVAASDIANESADITWSPSAGATAYNLSVATSAAPTVPVFTATGVTSPAAVTGLDPNTEYIASVVATAPGSTNSAAGTVTFTTTNVALAAPTGLASPSQTTTSIALSWNAVTNATSYGIEQSPAGAGTWTEIGTATGTTHNATGLTIDTDYDFRVAARGAGFVDSPWSATLTQSTLAA